MLARIADLVLNQPLLITAEKAEVIAGVLAGRIGIEGPELSRFEGTPYVIDEQGRVKGRPYRVTDAGVAIITITGSLVNRGAWVGAYSGLTSYEGIQHQLKVAREAPEVRSVILDIHSPGGEAIGCFETAAAVRDLAGKKRVVAVVNGMACSGGYAIASGATEIVTTGSGVSGSIGVVTLHVDASRQLEDEGLKPTLIIAGAHKADGHPFGPLPESVRADFQARVNGIYDAFIECVVSGRGSRTTGDQARATEARIYTGQEAVGAHLADRVGTFESVLEDLSRAAGRTSSQKGRSMSENTGAPAAETNAGAAQAAATFTQADLDAAVAKAKTEASADVDNKLKLERERIAALDELMSECAGNADAGKIVAEAKTSGAGAEATALKLIKAGIFKKVAVVNGMEADDKTAAGAAPAATAAGAGKPAVPQNEAGWKTEYEGSTVLQGEFLTAESYIAFKRDEARKGGAQ